MNAIRFPAMLSSVGLAVTAIFCVPLAAAATPATPGSLTLAEGGVSRFVIVLPDDAIPAEVSAARELRDYLGRITGASLPIVRESRLTRREQRIFVGPSSAARDLLPGHDWESLGSDGIVIKTLPDTLILAGGRPRGTLYAVYTFLEDTAGVRWWTDSEESVPSAPALSVPPLDIVYTPKLLYREVFNYDPNEHPRFAARLKVNGHFNNIPEDLGGHYNILGWVHTVYDLMPPATHFASHPDWYSLQGGNRNPEGGQLCWSNSDMLKELAANALKRVRKNPAAGIISISQNDWNGACQCEACAAIVEREGSQSGPIIQGVNAVAVEISKEYPDFLVDTLAYSYSRKPPRTIRPAKNVLIRLCSIEADFTHPLDSDANSAFRDDLLAWKAIAQNLFIWNYVTNFSDYLIPHPNMPPFAEDLRFFAANNVVGVFQQGDSFNRLAGDFLPLRAWLLAHLLWDPSRDQAKLQNEFLRGYYGPAAPHLAAYLDLVHEPARTPGFRMGCYNTDTSFLTSATLERATELFDQAARAVANDPDLSRRVRRERLALDHVKLLRYDFAPCVTAAKQKGEAACAEYDALAEEFVTAAQQAGVRHYSEGQEFHSYAPGLKSRCLQNIPPSLPAAGAPLPEGCFDLQEDRFRLAKPGEWAETVEDLKSSNGRAARMPGDHTEWAVQFHVPEEIARNTRGPWRCSIVARCDAKAKSGVAFQYGLYDAPNRAGVMNSNATLDIAGDGEYHPYAIFVEQLKPGQYFWVAPVNNPASVSAVYVDRIYLKGTPNGKK